MKTQVFFFFFLVQKKPHRTREFTRVMRLVSILLFKGLSLFGFLNFDA